MYGTISKKGRYLENYQETFYISGTVTQADLGKAVSLDATKEKTVKLAADGDIIVGRLEVLEARVQEGVTVCTVSMKFIDWVPYKDGLTAGDVAGIGKSIVGAGAGEVKFAAGTAHNRVVFLDATNRRAHVHFL